MALKDALIYDFHFFSRSEPGATEICFLCNGLSNALRLWSARDEFESEAVVSSCSRPSLVNRGMSVNIALTSCDARTRKSDQADIYSREKCLHIGTKSM